MAATSGDAVETLSSVFPGESVELRSIGKTVTVSEWGAKALVHEVPQKLGRIVGRLMPFAGQLRGGGVEAVLPPLLQAAGEDLADLVLWTAGLGPEDFGRMGAGDLMLLTAAVVRQNKDFFKGLADVIAALGIELAGSESRRPS